ncbi:MAG: pilus assembly protein PilM [Fuerstiella sp.]|nr:pilus assembly protein PilM [Fuerstiella sp.]
MPALVIEWDRDRLIVVSGIPASGRVDVQAALTVPRDTDNSPEELGTQLRRELATAATGTEQATVVLSRSLVTLRRIQLPHVSDQELPDMVRLQAATRLTVPLESVCMDFVPLPSHGEGLDVLLATTPAEQISDIRKTLEAAGLELSSVQVSSFGIASALVHAGKLVTTGESLEAIMMLRSNLIEFLFVYQGFVVFSHSGTSWSSPDLIEQTVRSEISRGRLAAAEIIGQHTVRQITLVGADAVTSAVPDEITERLDNSAIHRLDPIDSIVTGPLPDSLTSSDVLTAAGIIADQKKDRTNTIDLVNPRKPAERANNRRLRIAAASAAMLLLAIGAWKWRTSTISDLQTEIQDIETEVTVLENEFKNGEEEMEQDAAIGQWSQSNVDWLEEMNRIREVMGGTDRLLIRNFGFTAGQGTVRGTVTAECFARDRSDMEEFQRRLKAVGYDVVPRGTGLRSRDADYTTGFLLVLNLPLIEKGS